MECEGHVSEFRDDVAISTFGHNWTLSDRVNF